MSPNITNPITAIRRFESNQQRIVSEVVIENGINIIRSHIMNNKDGRIRIWYVNQNDIQSCKFNDQADADKNEMKILKFIKGWNK